MRVYEARSYRMMKKLLKRSNTNSPKLAVYLRRWTRRLLYHDRLPPSLDRLSSQPHRGRNAGASEQIQYLDDIECCVAYACRWQFEQHHANEYSDEWCWRCVGNECDVGGCGGVGTLDRFCTQEGSVMSWFSWHRFSFILIASIGESSHSENN